METVHFGRQRYLCSNGFTTIGNNINAIGLDAKK